MAPPAKVTDLTTVEGDPDPARADLVNPRMYLEMRARGPWRFGLVTFVARCSERAPVARALVVWLLLTAGITLAVAAHYLLPSHAPAWVAAAVPVTCVLVPFAMYQLITRETTRPGRRPLPCPAQGYREPSALSARPGRGRKAAVQRGIADIGIGDPPFPPPDPPMTESGRRITLRKELRHCWTAQSRRSGRMVPLHLPPSATRLNG
jgi:hypothetical protein